MITCCGILSRGQQSRNYQLCNFIRSRFSCAVIPRLPTACTDGQLSSIRSRAPTDATRSRASNCSTEVEMYSNRSEACQRSECQPYRYAGSGQSTVSSYRREWLNCSGRLRRRCHENLCTISPDGHLRSVVGLTYHSGGSTMPTFHAVWLHPLPNPVIVPYGPLGFWLRSKSSNG
jgi:hypothetical protein